MQQFEYCPNIKDNNLLLCGYTWEQQIVHVDHVLNSQVTIQHHHALLNYNRISKFYLMKHVGQHKLIVIHLYLFVHTLKLIQYQKFVNDNGVNQCQAILYLVDRIVVKIKYLTGCKTCNHQNLLTFARKCEKVSDLTCLKLSTAYIDQKIESTLSTTKKQDICLGLKIIPDLTKIATRAVVYKKRMFISGSSCDTISAYPDIYPAESLAE